MLINFDMVNTAKINVNVLDKSNVTYNSNEYYIKPDGSSLQSRLIYVNNVLMEYKDGKFPTIEPVTGTGEYIDLPPAPRLLNYKIILRTCLLE